MPSSDRKSRKRKFVDAADGSAGQRLSVHDPNITDLSTTVLAKIVSLCESFTEMCRLREVSSVFRGAVVKALKDNDLYITKRDRELNRHVAALRYAARVAKGCRVFLAPGDYILGNGNIDLERFHDEHDGDFDPFDRYPFDRSLGDDDFPLPWMEVRHDDYPGARPEWDDDGYHLERHLWGENEGPLVVAADGITLCRAPDADKVTITLDQGSDCDPSVHMISIVVRSKRVNLNEITTRDGPSLYGTKGSSLRATLCDFGGTVALCGSAILDTCTVQNGSFGGIAVAGRCKIKKCKLFDAFDDGEIYPTLDVQNEGTCKVQDSSVWVQSSGEDNERPSVFDSALARNCYEDVAYDSSKRMWCGHLRNGTHESFEDWL